MLALSSHLLHLVVDLAAGSCSTIVLEACDDGKGQRQRQREFPLQFGRNHKEGFDLAQSGFYAVLSWNNPVCAGLRGRVGMQMAECGWRTWDRHGSHFYSSPGLDGPRRIIRDEGGLVP